MTQNGAKVSIICKKGEFNALYRFLEEQDFALLSYENTSDAVDCEQFTSSQVVIMDVDQQGEQCFELINALNIDTPQLRVIVVGDLTQTVFPENIPRVFHFIRKPFEPDKMKTVIDEALSRDFTIEKRREPRIPIELPVELYFDMKFWRTHTRNVSLHGMQTVWDDTSADEIRNRHTDGTSPISACRLYLDPDSDGSDPDSHLNITLDLRYIDVNNPTLLGFEFRGLDLDLRSRLQQILIW